jgi:two-component system, cell cycle sensor histidine kinase and response regulator CckA
MLKHSVRSKMGLSRILLGGVVIGLVIWVAEGMLHFLVFDRQNVVRVLFPATMNEFWMRSLVTGLFIGLGAYAQTTINKLRESRERYWALFENAPDAIFLADVESGKILDANPAAACLLLRPHEELVGHHQSQLHPPGLEDDSKKIFIEHVERIRQGEKVQRIEHVALRSDGMEVPVEIAAQLIHIDGRSTVQGIFRDLTEQKKAQEELENATKRLRTVLDSLDALVYVSDMDTHKVLFANKYGQDIWGDITGDVCWQALQSGQSGPCEFCTNNKLINSDGEPTGVYKWEFQNTVDGQWYSCHDQAIQWADGRLVRIEIASNITEHKQAQDALKESEEKYRRIIEDQTEFLVRWLPDGTRTFVNDSYLRYFGVSRDQAIGTSFFPLITEDYREAVRKRIESATPEKPASTDEHKVIRSDGTIAWNQWTDRAIFNREGRLTEFQSVGRDVTERKQTQEALQQSEKKYRSLFENMLDGFAYHKIVIDEVNQPVDYVFLEINEAFERITGLKRQEVIGKRVTQVIPGIQETDFDWIGEYGKVALEGKESRFEQHSRELDRWYSISAYSPQREYFAVTFEDITERKAAENALRRHNKFLADVLESLTHPFLVINTNDYTVEIANSAAWKAELAKGVTCYEMSHRLDCPCGQAEQFCPLDQVKKTGRPVTVEHIHYDQAGNARDVEVHGYPLLDDQGKVTKAIIYCLDVTERKRVMDEVEAYRDKMFRAEQLASIGTIGSGLAHQFNQPLSVIRMSVQKALRNLDEIDCPGIVKEVLNDGLSEVSRASSVAKEFLALGHKFSEGRIVNIDINEMAQRALSAFHQMARRVGIRLTALDNLETLPSISGVASELEQMFFILVQNAIQAAAAKEGQWFTISGRGNKEQIELTFSDNCGGIDPDHLDKIFEPFFSTKSTDQGTGLGLTILQQIVTNHNGRIQVESELGRGTSFHVTLPLECQE